MTDDIKDDLTANGSPAHDDANAPEGFKPLRRGGPFFGLMGPLFTKRDADGAIVIGLRVADKHTNMLGITHGGMLVTLADGALGINISSMRQPPQAMVTVNLSSDFIGSAHPGDWLEAHVRISKQGARLAFAECELLVGERLVLRCSGVFAVVSRPAQASKSTSNDG
jgi:uncharacterized protein (TIGR00369 family)